MPCRRHVHSNSQNLKFRKKTEKDASDTKKCGNTQSNSLAVAATTQVNLARTFLNKDSSLILRVKLFDTVVFRGILRFPRSCNHKGNCNPAADRGLQEKTWVWRTDVGAAIYKNICCKSNIYFFLFYIFMVLSAGILCTSRAKSLGKLSKRRLYLHLTNRHMSTVLNSTWRWYP